MFYAWECVSLMMDNFTTVDLVIRDNHSLMCLLHVLFHNVKSQEKNASSKSCLSQIKFIKAKMKLSYTCRKQQVEMADLFYNALFRTLRDHRTLAVYKIQKLAAMHAPVEQEVANYNFSSYRRAKSKRQSCMNPHADPFQEDDKLVVSIIQEESSVQSQEFSKDFFMT